MTIFEIDGLDALPLLVGKEVGVSDWLVMDQDRITRFAEVTEDLQWIHLDADRAKRESPYGRTIAHGYLTLSVLPRLFNSCIALRGARMGVNYGLNRVRFMAPVCVEDRIRARFSLLSCEPITGGVQVVWKAAVEVEGGDKPACVAEMVSRRYS